MKKTDNKIERNNKKIKKNNRKDDQHDWRKHLNENYFQKRKCCILDVFDVYDQRAFKTMIQQRNEINNMNQKKLKEEESVEDERSENNYVNI